MSRRAGKARFRGSTVFENRLFREIFRRLTLLLLLGTALHSTSSAAAILWSDLGATLAHETGAGSDILGGALKRDDTATNTLYFKFHVDPLSDANTEEYFAAFQLFEGDEERLGVGNSQKAWAYSVFNAAETGDGNKVYGDMDLRSARPESSAPGVFLPYEFPRRGIEVTIVFKVEYAAHGDDLVTVWINPNLSPNATEAGQPDSLTTRFRANASFNQVRLRHGGGGSGWTFSGMAVATSFNDFVAAPGDANEAVRGARPLAFRSWLRENGLPQNSVHALTQTHDGYIWIGSDDGAARFDGVRFVPLGVHEGLRSRSVHALLEDSERKLWIGTRGGGLACWQDGAITNYTTREGLPGDSVTSLAEDKQGRLWVGTESGLAVIQGGRLVAVPAVASFNGKHITSIYCDRSGAVWVGVAGAGLFELRNSQFAQVAEASVEGLLQDPHCILVDRTNRLWVGAGEDYVLCRDGGQWRRYRMPRHLARPYVSALAEEADGTVWAGSLSEGLLQFHNGKLTAVDASAGLSDNLVESLLVDREGNLWVGTSTGLNRVRRSELNVIGQNEGLGYGPVQGLADIAPDVIWAGKPGDGLYRRENGSFAPLTTSDPALRYAEINAMLAVADGSCWVAGARGLLHFQNPRATVPEVEGPLLADAKILALAEDRTEGLWAGTRDGRLWRRRGGTWVAQTNFPPTHAITALAQDKAGVIWAGTEGGGLYRYENGKAFRLDPSVAPLPSDIRALYVDTDGTLWIGTSGGGLGRWAGGRLVTITAREGLSDNTISQILEDKWGRLWLGCNRGLVCLRKSEVDDFAAGKERGVHPELYGRAEGMASEQCASGFSPAGLRTGDGRLWFPTLKGIVTVNPRPPRTNAPAPPVTIEEIALDGSVLRPGGTKSATPVAVGARSVGEIRIGPGKHRLDIRFTAFNLAAPERVRFRYRLEGFDTEWTEARGERVASYSYVPAGNFQFQVAACNEAGAWSEEGPSLGVVVARHFYQALWFVLPAGAALALLIAVTVRVVEKRRHHRRMRQMEQERAVERERTRISQDLHDDLGSSLTRISLLSDLVKADKDSPAQVETYATKISQSAGQTVRALEEIVWALRPGSDSLQSLVEYIAHFANELFEDDATRCRLDLPPELPAYPLPPEMRHNIFLVVKEALTNALKHAGAREVRLQARVSPDSLELVVQDDGRGFDPNTAPGPGKHHGLGNMRARAASIGGSLAVESRPGQGTTVRFTFPFT